jgi:hypothetical protein
VYALKLGVKVDLAKALDTLVQVIKGGHVTRRLDHAHHCDRAGQRRRAATIRNRIAAGVTKTCCGSGSLVISEPSVGRLGLARAAE